MAYVQELRQELALKRFERESELFGFLFARVSTASCPALHEFCPTFRRFFRGSSSVASPSVALAADDTRRT